MSSQYKVKTEFRFAGYFIVKANSEQDAQTKVQDFCGMVLGGDIHTCLPNDEVDWEFPVHPEAVIKTVKKISE